MIYRTPKELIRDYFNSGVLSQSRLKLLTQGVDVFNNIKDEKEATMYFEEKGYFIIGSAVDCILTESRAAFVEQFHMADCPKPSETIMSIVNQIFDAECRINEGYPAESLLALQAGDNAELIENAIEFHSYQPNWKMPTKIEKIVSGGDVYYQELVASVGKTILSLEQYDIVEAIVNSIMANPLTALPFSEEIQVEGLDFLHQVIIVFNYRGVDIQCLLDILRVDHRDKTLKVIDFKTMMEATIKFASAMRMRRYDFQVVIYSMALREWKRQNPQYLDYSIVNPGFICETTAPGRQGNPLCYTITNELTEVAINGGASYDHFEINEIGRGIDMVSKKIWGINETFDLYKWHLEHGFEKDRIVVENSGHLELNWEGIKGYGNTVK